MVDVQSMPTPSLADLVAKDATLDETLQEPPIFKREDLEEECWLALCAIGTERIKYKHVSGSIAINGEGHGYDLVCLPYDFVEFGIILAEEWWENCGKQYNGDTFAAFRKGNINLIVVADEEKYFLWLKALTRCKDIVTENGGEKLSREERCRVFKEIVDDAA